MLRQILMKTSRQISQLGSLNQHIQRVSTSHFDAIKSVTKSQNTAKCQTVSQVENLLSKGDEGRLFAVVHLCGKQFKITDGDIILVEGYWPPTAGDKINFNKVLCVGGKDFSLIGTPILQPGLVDIQATVIEKTLTHTKTNFRKKKTKQFMRINFVRNQNTMIRINSIQINGNVKQLEKPLDFERIF